MKKVVVASLNPVKINAVQKGFESMFKDGQFSFEGVSVSSGVSDQPMTDEETYTGAYNRVTTLSNETEADFWVGIEGGLEEKEGNFEVAAWVIIRSKEGMWGKGRSSTFFLPNAVAKLIREGKELAVATDAVFNESGSGRKQGSVGILTHNVIDRTEYYVHPVVMALIPFKNPQWY